MPKPPKYQSTQLRRPPVGLGVWGELLPRQGFSRVRFRLGQGVGGSLDTINQGTTWRSHDGLAVISSCIDAELPGTDPPLPGPTWHLSVSTIELRRTHSERPTNADLAHVADCFGLEAWEEDNHYPGVARHIWCPIDPAYRSDCSCKTTERNVVEPDGFTWTTPKDGPCRGCDYRRMHGSLYPCPLHPMVEP